MGVVNVTPDSFSDGGRYLDPDLAVAHALDLVSAGADFLDVGGESTRPGAEPVDADEEIARVLPVVETLAATCEVPVSIDTTKATVADAALRAGAVIVNDVSAGNADADMFATVAEHDAGYIAMHMRGTPRTMQDAVHYDNVVADVCDELIGRLDAARAAGIAATSLAADPGIGFAKNLEHNLELLAHIDVVRDALGVPLVVGPSRKRFIGEILRGGGLTDVEAHEREEGTLAAVAWLAESGVDVVRVHETASAARVVALASDVAA